MMHRSVVVFDGDRLDELEQNFILRKFEECLPLAEKLLEQISDASPVGSQGIWNLHHRCVDAAECDCIRLVTVFIQVLYELGRADEVINFVVSFYGDEHLPFSIVWLCANLLLSTNRGDEAQNLIGYYLVSKRAEVTTAQSETLRADYDRLLDFLLLRVLAPRNAFKVAHQLLNEQRTVISETSFLEFSRKLTEAERDQELHDEAARASARFTAAQTTAGALASTSAAVTSSAASTAVGPMPPSTLTAAIPKSGSASISPAAESALSPRSDTSSNYWNLVYAFSAVSLLYMLYRVLKNPRLRQILSSLRQSMRELLGLTLSSHYGAASAVPHRR